MAGEARVEPNRITAARRRQGVGLVVLTSALWGTAYPVIRPAVTGAGAVRPSALLLGRFGVAAVALIPFLRPGRRLWAAAVQLGVLVWVGYACLAVGLRDTTVGRGSFLVALSVVFVPVWTGVRGGRVRPAVWAAAGLALAGVGLLGGDVASGPVNRGDAWAVGCALAWAAYTVRLGAFAADFPALTLTAAQLSVVAGLSVAWAAADGTLPGHGGPAYPWVAAVWLGLVATVLPTGLQTVAQRWVPAPQVAVLFTLEPVWASAVAWGLGGDRLGSHGLAGAGLVLAAAALAQWPGRRPDVAGRPV